MARFESIDAFVAAIPAMAARSRDLLRGHDGLFRLDTRQGRTFFMRLSDGEMTLPENPPDTTDCRVTADEADLLRIVNIAIALENTDLLDSINDALATLDEEGVLDAIVSKYIGAAE